MASKLCTLKNVVGETERCPEDRCAFWEPGGAVLPGGCAVERLGLSAELGHTKGLAEWLLALRGELEDAAPEHDRGAVHSRFNALLPPGLRD